MDGGRRLAACAIAGIKVKAVFEECEKVYGKLVTTPEIAMEFGEELPDWI